MTLIPGVELVVVGDELLSGRTIDTNSAFLGRRLAAIGLPVNRRTVVGDDARLITEMIEQASERAGLVFVVGGLGPTSDDQTLAAVAALLGRKLVNHPPTLRRIEARFRRSGRRVPAAARQQARVVAGARLFPNPVGMVPASIIERQGRIIVLLPGVPAELEALFDRVEPALGQRFLRAPLYRTQVRTIGKPESVLATGVERSLRRFSGVATAYYPSTSGVDIVLTASSEPELEQALAAVRRVVGTAAYEIGNRSLEELVGDLLRTRRLTIATAESCTAGMIAVRLTAVPGSSDYYRGGVVAYADAAKRELLEVSAATLARHGAVSRAVAQEMALGVCGRLQADLGVGITGIAGPDGGSPAKPVGLVFIAVALKGRVQGERFMFSGPRRAVREQATAAALDLCRRVIESR